jgi:hypothetical protein
MVVSTLNGSEIWAITRKQGANIEIAEMKFLRNVAAYTWKDQTRNTRIMEEQKIFNQNVKILIQIAMEISRATNGRQMESEESFNINT